MQMYFQSILNRTRSAISKIAAIIGGLTVGLIICEVMLRVFYPQVLYSFEQHLFMQSEDYGYALTPNTEKAHSQPEYSYTIRSNSFGFRGKEPNFTANYRVLVLGDSYGMGQGVPEGRNLCDVSQKYFDEHLVDIDIFNTSLSGYSGVNELYVLKKFVKTYRPDLVVLLFYWNDIGATESLFVQNGYLVLRIGNRYTAALREWANNHSHLYCLIKKFYYSNIKKTSDKLVLGKFPDKEIGVTVNNLNAMKEICDNSNSEFVVILLPLHGIDEGSPEFVNSKQIFSSMLKSALIEHVDWAEVLPKNNRNRLIFSFDRHWNEIGHAFFGMYLREIILSKYEKTEGSVSRPNG